MGILLSWLVNHGPTQRTPLRNKGLIRPNIQGNQWLISPDHKALFLGRVPQGGRLTSHDFKQLSTMESLLFSFHMEFFRSLEVQFSQEFSNNFQ